MEHITVCKIYFSQGDKAPNLTFLQKHGDGNLGNNIMRNAKAFGIEQAISYYVTSGY